VPLIAKVNTQDFLQPPAPHPGQTIAETIAVAHLLKQAGLDALELRSIRPSSFTTRIVQNRTATVVEGASELETKGTFAARYGTRGVACRL